MTTQTQPRNWWKTAWLVVFGWIVFGRVLSFAVYSGYQQAQPVTPVTDSIENAVERIQ